METKEPKINSRSLLMNESKLLVFYCLFMFLSVTFSIGGLIVITLFIDEMVNDPTQVKVSLYVAPIVVCTIMSTICLTVRTKIKAKIISNISNRLTKEAYNSLLTCDIYDSKLINKKEIISRVTYDSYAISEYYIGKNFLSFIETLIILITCAISSLLIYTLGGITFIIITPFYIGIAKTIELVSQKSLNNYETLKDKKQYMFDKTYDNLINIKLENSNKNLNNEFNNINSDFSNAYSKKTLYYSLSTIILLIFTIGFSLSVSYGIGVAFNFKNLSIGKLVYITISTPLYFVILDNCLKARLSRKDISLEETEMYNIINMKDEINNNEINSLDDVRTLNFRNVSYSYLDDNTKDNLLNNLDFELKRGEKIGIYSIDKEEKDAIYESITRIRKISSGEILINNNDINKISVDYLRNIITSISDVTEINYDSIENMVSYPYNYDDYKFNEAINKSGLREFLNDLPDKAKTVFSKKEIHNINNDSIEARLKLANAIYRDSSIYILNDFTKSLNPELENELINGLFSLKGKIVVLITDHFNLLNKCDKIIIIVDGKIIEYGKTSELLQDSNSILYKRNKKSNRTEIEE